MLLFLVISLFSDFFGLILGSDFRDGLFIIPVHYCPVKVDE